MPKEPNTIIESIIVISVISILVAFFVILFILYFKRTKTALINETKFLEENSKRQILQTQMEVQEMTFQHISRELHDNVGQLLSTVRMQIGIIERTTGTPKDILATANSTLGLAIQELRSLSKTLDKDWLSMFSFTDNLKNEIDRINLSGKVTASFNFNDPVILEVDKQIVLFRIVQEAIQNAIKHAQPTTISIETYRDEEQLKIIIENDGAGFEVTQTNLGLGIRNMQNRSALLSGSIRWTGGRTGGTIVEICIPIK